MATTTNTKRFTVTVSELGRRGMTTERRAETARAAAEQALKACHSSAWLSDAQHGGPGRMEFTGMLGSRATYTIVVGDA